MENSQIKNFSSERIEALLFNIEKIIKDVKCADFAGALKSSVTLTTAGLGLPIWTPAYYRAKHLRHKLYYHGIDKYSSDDCLAEAYGVKDVLSKERMRRFGFVKLDQTRIKNKV